jgi:periplasmic divalent cation tolerance protein
MYIVVFVTVPHKEEAQRIAHALVEKKLVACVTMVNTVESVFWWEGKVDHAQETLLIIKSKKSKLNALMKLVKQLHSYQVPEIIALPLVGGHRPYLKWIDESIR